MKQCNKITKRIKHSIERRIPLLVALMLSTTVFLTQQVFAGIGLEPVEKLLPERANGNYQGATYRALIIGNDNYIDPEKRWPSLQTAVTDANAIASLLKSQYGFRDVTLLENATRREILQAISQLTKRVTNDDSVLLFYAGHGYLDSETDRGYWIPVDAVGRDHTTYLRNSTIRDELNILSKRAKHTLLISDSCFSRSLLRGVTRGPVPDTNKEQYIREVSAKKSVQIITAGGEEFVDDSYSDSGHSPFTYFLLNELNHNEKPVITASELSSNVEKAVSNNTKQVPESGVLQNAGDELGEFIFLKIDVTVEGVPKEKVKVQVNVNPESHDTGSGEKSSPEQPLKKKVAPVPLPTM